MVDNTYLAKLKKDVTMLDTESLMLIKRMTDRELLRRNELPPLPPIEAIVI